MDGVAWGRRRAVVVDRGALASCALANVAPRAAPVRRAAPLCGGSSPPYGPHMRVPVSIGSMGRGRAAAWVQRVQHHSRRVVVQEDVDGVVVWPATPSELDAAVETAAQAQKIWTNTNPQKRSRVMFAYKQLVDGHMDELAALLSSEHGKVIADSRGDVMRGVDVIEFACGIPHSQKGEHTYGAGP